MKVLGIIPARFASSRFPGKPLVKINGKTMIQHVYEKVSQAMSDLCVATDNEEIVNHVKQFGGNVVFTSEEHLTGTSRCIEAYEQYTKNGNSCDIVVNIQGDEPTINPEQLHELISCFDDTETEIATLVKNTNNSREIFNSNVVKVVFNKKQFAMYFSRSPIPYVRGVVEDEWKNQTRFYKHIGIYGFRSDVFLKLKNLESSNLENAESLEQLNWLYNRYSIKVKETKFENIGIDTPEDLEYLLRIKNLNL